MFDRVLITSGPTREPLDPVRFLGNRSSGLTGWHLARVFSQKFAGEVVVVSGPVCRYPEGVTLIKVETAREMHAAVFRYFANAGVVIMAAAVSDFRPETASAHKLKKADCESVLKLVPNPDILYQAGKQRTPEQILVGFAAETRDAVANGKLKFRQKNLDLLVVNEITKDNPAFEVESNQVFLITADEVVKLPRLKKSELAEKIADEVVRINLRKNRSRDTDE